VVYLRGDTEADALQPAWLLHARDYRDSCLIVELLTRSGGRISAVARGARRSRKGYSQRSILQPFQPLWVETFGRGELKTLRNVESRDGALPLRGRALFSGLYLNELLCRILHRDDPHDTLFEDYATALTELVQTQQLDIVLRQFEFRLLQELGYGFSLDTDADSGSAVTADSHYRFDVQRGLILQHGVGAQPLFSGRDLMEFASGNYSEGARRALKLLCRLALRPHLGDKPLLSRQLFFAER
jgi:DNA repair protein RecO (recombination protein O)